MPDSNIGVKLERVDRILRQGAGPEFAELYHAVGRFRHQRIGEEDALTAYARRVCECFDACEEALADSDDAIDAFKEDTDGQ